MEKDRIIKLTNALYKVTSLFPEKETLGISIRKRGNLILSFFVIIKNKELSLSQEELQSFNIKCRRNVEILLSFFEIAESQNWINPKNFEILKVQYNEILKELESIKVVEKKVEAEKEPKKIEKKRDNGIFKKEAEEPKFTLTQIQEKVITILQGNGRMKPCDINQFFPDLNPRSVRRELQDLKSRGIIVSNGSGKKTLYEMNSYF
ncbi:MAG: hypothetical protein PHG24_01130 [Candidatus Pacebacteria bacterium]|nr:hypothetical protein [Candidatus Paceibacterota bacterium]